MTLSALLFILMQLQRSPETIHESPQNKKVEAYRKVKVKVEVKGRTENIEAQPSSPRIFRLHLHINLALTQLLPYSI
jgi:hypothetical protein